MWRNSVDNYTMLASIPISSVHSNDYMLVKNSIYGYPSGVYQRTATGFNLVHRLLATNITALIENGTWVTNGQGHLVSVSNALQSQIIQVNNHVISSSNSLGLHIVSVSNSLYWTSYFFAEGVYNQLITYITNKDHATRLMVTNLVTTSTQGLGSKATISYVQQVSNGAISFSTQWSKTHSSGGSSWTMQSNLVHNLIDTNSTKNLISKSNHNRPNVYMSTIFPNTNNDNSDSAGIGTRFKIGDLWKNTINGLFLCTGSNTLHSTWVNVYADYSNNVILGNSLTFPYGHTGGANNLSYGSFSMQANNGANNIALGYGSFAGNTGDYNIAIGESSMQNNANAYLQGNVSVGGSSMKYPYDSFNVAIGYGAGGSYPTAGKSILIGQRVGYSNGATNLFMMDNRALSKTNTYIWGHIGTNLYINARVMMSNKELSTKQYVQNVSNGCFNSARSQDAIQDLTYMTNTNTFRRVNSISKYQIPYFLSPTKITNTTSWIDQFGSINQKGNTYIVTHLNQASKFKPGDHVWGLSSGAGGVIFKTNSMFYNTGNLYFSSPAEISWQLLLNPTNVNLFTYNEVLTNGNGVSATNRWVDNEPYSKYIYSDFSNGLISSGGLSSHGAFTINGGSRSTFRMGAGPDFQSEFRIQVDNGGVFLGNTTTHALTLGRYQDNGGGYNAWTEGITIPNGYNARATYGGYGIATTNDISTNNLSIKGMATRKWVSNQGYGSGSGGTWSATSNNKYGFTNTSSLRSIFPTKGNVTTNISRVSNTVMQTQNMRAVGMASTNYVNDDININNTPQKITIGGKSLNKFQFGSNIGVVFNSIINKSNTTYTQHQGDYMIRMFNSTVSSYTLFLLSAYSNNGKMLSLRYRKTSGSGNWYIHPRYGETICLKSSNFIANQDIECLQVVGHRTNSNWAIQSFFVPSMFTNGSTNQTALMISTMSNKLFSYDRVVDSIYTTNSGNIMLQNFTNYVSMPTNSTAIRTNASRWAGTIPSGNTGAFLFDGNLATYIQTRSNGQVIYTFSSPSKMNGCKINWEQSSPTGAVVKFYGTNTGGIGWNVLYTNSQGATADSNYTSIGSFSTNSYLKVRLVTTNYSSISGLIYIKDIYSFYASANNLKSTKGDVKYWITGITNRISATAISVTNGIGTNQIKMHGYTWTSNGIKANMITIGRSKTNIVASTQGIGYLNSRKNLFATNNNVRTLIATSNISVKTYVSNVQLRSALSNTISYCTFARTNRSNLPTWTISNYPNFSIQTNWEQGQNGTSYYNFPNTNYLRYTNMQGSSSGGGIKIGNKGGGVYFIQVNAYLYSNGGAVACYLCIKQNKSTIVRSELFGQIQQALYSPSPANAIIYANVGDVFSFGISSASAPLIVTFVYNMYKIR
jgi:hypothetical protein